MRVYNVLDTKTGPRGLKAKTNYFPNRISVNFVFPGHTEVLPGHIELEMDWDYNQKVGITTNNGWDYNQLYVFQ